MSPTLGGGGGGGGRQEPWVPLLGPNLRTVIWSQSPRCSTTMDPREKLEVLERTYGEIEATVSRVLGQEHKLPMDDLLPLLIYVVSRAR